MSQVTTPTLPERENLYRCVAGGVELRADGDAGDGPVMSGHFAVFDQWTEINSIFEGRFLERFAPGAFAKTIKENRESMRVLFQHGFDGVVGDKPLGPIRELREDDEGAYYEVPLLEASYVRDQVLPGLEAGLYGASFRFRVLREEIVENPEPSEDNPNGIPERTVKEAQVREFGPVTFPAYSGASAGVRSLTDEVLASRLAQDPERFSKLLENVSPRAASTEEAPEADTPRSGNQEPTAPPNDSAGSESHSDVGRRAEDAPLYGAKPKTPSWRL